MPKTNSYFKKMENLGEILESELEFFRKSFYYRNALPNWNEKIELYNIFY